MLNPVYWKRVLIALNVVACLSAIALTARALVVPAVAKAIFKDSYKELVFKCDNTMRDHLVAKNQVLQQPSDQAVRALHAAEVGLLTCHEYDKLRKRLLVLGLTDADLAEMGLEAIEERAKDVRSFVETHELRY